jgi:N-formylglutamate amidohydrolase
MWTIKYEENRMVSRHAGSLPVLLTCPHGATAKPVGVPQRNGSTPNCPPFKISGDRFTRDITTAVAQLILETLGEAPYVVIAEYHRKYIDANRSRKCAFEVPAAEPFYDEYHQTVRSFVDAILAENGPQGLLLDIHGTTTIPTDPAAVYIGTDNGESVQRLLSDDPLAVWRKRSLRGLLQAAGYVVSPALPGVPETPEVDGGFTTRTYGSSHDDGLDAMQIEIAQPIRENEKPRSDFIEHFGRAVASIAARSFVNRAYSDSYD